MKIRKDKWIPSLTWSNIELKGIMKGIGSDAYTHTHNIYPIPKSFRKKARKELRRRLSKI